MMSLLICFAPCVAGSALSVVGGRRVGCPATAVGGSAGAPGADPGGGAVQGHLHTGVDLDGVSHPAADLPLGTVVVGVSRAAGRRGGQVDVEREVRLGRIPRGDGDAVRAET